MIEDEMSFYQLLSVFQISPHAPNCKSNLRGHKKHFLPLSGVVKADVSLDNINNIWNINIQKSFW